jgi:hypothetical protein
MLTSRRKELLLNKYLHPRCLFQATGGFFFRSGTSSNYSTNISFSEVPSSNVPISTKLFLAA